MNVWKDKRKCMEYYRNILISNMNVYTLNK